MNWVEISKSKDVEQVSTAIDVLYINEQDDRGRTPLMLFLTNRMPIEAIQCLLESKPDLELKDKLGDTALKKAVKFKQVEAIQLLIEHGAKLDDPLGIQASAWNLARRNPDIADMLLDTDGAVRLKLTQAEQAVVDGILYEESSGKAAAKIRELDSAVLLHAIVNEYNWDDSPEPMIAVCEHPECAEITRLDMAELLDAEYWLEMDEDDITEREDGPAYRQLAEQLSKRR
ncbi:MAG: DUF4274 domain-containing protein [Paenibacillus sp.]|uniref:DUF4274 domain-containing protein n=1 Tax=Paenibacillus sp. TaxID=58172 RepID=UPI0025ED3074|nr:DUF4274 domain-containing protein [Paenibacillus sp.]MBR2564207.1 DUF4274 domain-containing protein [Paenibacillus sp.]